MVCVFCFLFVFIFLPVGNFRNFMGKNIYSERWGKGPNNAEYFDQKKHWSGTRGVVRTTFKECKIIKGPYLQQNLLNHNKPIICTTNLLGTDHSCEVWCNWTRSFCEVLRASFYVSCNTRETHFFSLKGH
jgi:hypothetical protein